MAAVPPVAPAGPAAPAAPVLPTGPPSWRELFTSADRIFIEPTVDYATLSVALFASAEAPDILLSRVESLAQRSPVIVALVTDEEPERISLLKNPRRFTGSLANPSPLDGLVFGFSGPDSRTLAAVHLPTAAFETSAAYNVLDDPAAIRAGLEALPPDQTFHAYVNAGTPDMTNSGCRRALVLPMPWYAELAAHPDGISLKDFYDQFLATLPAAERPNYIDTFTWWRHAASRAAGAGARERSGLQVPTAQVLPTALRATREGWARTEVDRILAGLRAAPPPLTDTTFAEAFQNLRADLALQHAAREARELAQFADREAREDRRDAEQTFEGRFGAAKLEEVLRLLNLASQDDLPDTLRALARNKKKSDDQLVLQMAIDERASAPASAADEYTKPQLSTHIIDLFRSYAWAATGDELSDGITPFNITFVSEPASKAVAAKVQRLVTVESGGTAMSYSDAEKFLKNDASFPVDTTACGFRLAAHSVLVDIMMGPTAPFAVAYRQCVQALQSNLQLSLKLHYGETGGGAYHMALRIMYWLTQQFLYYLSERKFNRDPAIPDFQALTRHTLTKTLDGFLGQLPATWLEHVQPAAATVTTAKATSKTDKAKGAHTPVTNTNYNNAIKKRWEAGAFASIKAMLDAHAADTEVKLPKFGADDACLSWLLKGRCFADCPRVNTHKQAAQPIVAQTHALLDACGVAPSN